MYLYTFCLYKFLTFPELPILIIDKIRGVQANEVINGYLWAGINHNAYPEPAGT